MKYSILWATDGNDSLKRLDRREPATEKGTLGASVESIDTRKVRGNFYISRADVDCWDLSKLPRRAREVCVSILFFLHC